MSYRKVWLTNGDDDTFDLTNLVDDAFLSNLSGFGASATNTLTRIGNGQLASSVSYDFIDFGGTLYFTNDNTNAKAYDRYTYFFTFINRYPIYFHYQTPAMVEENYIREVLIKSISKSEVDKDAKTLVCSISFTPLTFWMSSKETIIEVDATRDVGKKYPLTRPYAYANAGYEDVVINNNSPTNVPIIIEIDGECTNPAYSLYNSKGEVYGVGRFIGTFDYVYVNSDDLEEEIKLSQNGVWIANPVNYQDASVGIPNQAYLTFLYLRSGKNGMKFTFSGSFNGTIRIRFVSGLYATI